MLVMSAVTSLPATKAVPDVTGVIPVSMARVVVCMERPEYSRVQQEARNMNQVMCLQRKGSVWCTT